ncbi:MAG TPA: hypothetical protein VGV87_04695 [Blastocatellia bacterium]|nr:hypothetical protein [Blastocatellia bacterium]
MRTDTLTHLPDKTEPPGDAQLSIFDKLAACPTPRTWYASTGAATRRANKNDSDNMYPVQP